MICDLPFKSYFGGKMFGGGGIKLRKYPISERENMFEKARRRKINGAELWGSQCYMLWASWLFWTPE